MCTTRDAAPSSRGLGRRPLKAETGIRIPLGLPRYSATRWASRSRDHLERNQVEVVIMAAFHRITLSASVLCCLLAMAVPIRADDVSGAINGFVYGGNMQGHHGVPVGNATVTVTSADGSATVSRHVTDGNGFFTFLGLLPGRYYISAAGLHYRTHCYTKAVVVPGSLVHVMLQVDSARVLVRCAHQDWGDEGIIF
jgi:Carboxypeptidase regulatory-like domain